MAEPPHEHLFYRWEQQDLLLWVTVQAGAKQNQIMGVQGNRLRVRLAAPAIEGKANQALISLLSDLFQVAPSRLAIEAGETSKLKRVRIRSPRFLPDFIDNSIKNK